MTIQEIEQKLDNAVEKFRFEMNECKKALAELKENSGKWKPKKGEQYHFLSGPGFIEQCKWTDSTKDNFRAKYLLIFPTKEECDKYWHFMDTVKEKSYEFSKEEWEDWNIDKHYIYYDFEDKEFFIEQNTIDRDLGTYYFKAEEDAKYIIDNFKDELMEYWI